MSDLNLVVVSGRLTRDVECRFVPNGTAVADFSVALNRIWYKDDAKQEETTFVDCVVFGKQAEFAGKLQKGDYVMVTGRLKEDVWIDKDQNKRRKLQIHVDKLDRPPRASSTPDVRARQVAEEQVDFDTPATTEDVPF